MGGRGKGTFSDEQGPGVRERVAEGRNGTPPHRTVRCVMGRRAPGHVLLGAVHVAAGCGVGAGLGDWLRCVQTC